MAQIIDQNPGFGATFGSGLGAGLSSGIKKLAEDKINDLTRRAQQQESKAASNKAFSGIFNDELSQLLSGYGPDQQVALLKTLGESGALASLMSGNEQLPSNNQQVPNGIQNTGPEQFNPEQSNLAPGQMQAASPNTPSRTPMTLAQAFSQPSQKRRLEQEKLDIKKDDLQFRQELETLKFIKPVMEGQRQDLVSAKKIHKIATRMLKDLRENGDRFPAGIFSYADPKIFRDPVVRRYAADANALVIQLANARKGQPTNYKIKMEELSKASLDQPIETQESILKNIIDDTDDVFDIQRSFNDIKKSGGGRFTVQLASDLADRVGLPDRLSSSSKSAADLSSAAAQGWQRVEDEETGQILVLGQDGQYHPEGEEE